MFGDQVNGTKSLNIAIGIRSQWHSPFVGGDRGTPRQPRDRRTRAFGALHPIAGIIPITPPAAPARHRGGCGSGLARPRRDAFPVTAPDTALIRPCNAPVTVLFRACYLRSEEHTSELQSLMRI